MRPSTLTVVEDLELTGRPVVVECPECGKRANRVLTFGPRGQEGPKMTWVVTEHELWPCGCRTARPVVFQMGAR